MASLKFTDITFIADSFPFLQHLDLSFPGGGGVSDGRDYDNAMNLLAQKLSKLRSVNLSGLVSINVSGCDKLTNSSFFALLTNCPLLADIRMESTDIGLGPTPSVVDLVVYPQLKSLHLAYNAHLQDNLINIFGFIFPNMQLIDFSFCPHVFQHQIALLLKKCPKIAHLKFAGFPHAKLRSINFEASNLMEVLNLSHSRIDVEGLYQISKICPQLMQLDLEHCYYVTEKGVRLAIENCTRLREINLQHCRKVSTDIVSWMIFSRPSLRKITAPPHFRPRDCDRKLLFERCLVF